MSQKNIPNIFNCNLKKNYQTVTIFITNIPEITAYQMTYLTIHLTQRLFLHYLGKPEPTWGSNWSCSCEHARRRLRIDGRLSLDRSSSGSRQLPGWVSSPIQDFVLRLVCSVTRELTEAVLISPTTRQLEEVSCSSSNEWTNTKYHNYYKPLQLLVSVVVTSEW